MDYSKITTDYLKVLLQSGFYGAYSEEDFKHHQKVKEDILSEIQKRNK